MIFGSFEVLSCQFGKFCLSLWSIWVNLDVKDKFPLRRYYCNSSTSFPVQDGQCSFSDRRTRYFSYFWLWEFVQLCNLSCCKQMFPHWACPMFWWMAKNSVTTDTYDSRAAGLLNSTVQVKSPWRRISRIIPGNRTVQVYIHWSPPSVEDDL